MSYSVPGPQGPHFRGTFPREGADAASAVSQARQETERLAAQRATPPEKSKDGPGSKSVQQAEIASSVGADALSQLFEHEQIRTSARASGDAEVANHALRDVVGDLDKLLSHVETHLEESARGRSRQTVREAVPQLTAMSNLAALPLVEVADLLGLPRESADGVINVLARDGGFSPVERHYALRDVKQLREELRQVEISKDHTLLDRLIRFIMKIAIPVVVAIGAAPVAALSVGESMVKEVIKAAVVTLVAFALQGAANRVKEHYLAPDNDLRETHRALLEELRNAQFLVEEPHYEGEHAVVRIRLAVRCGVVRVALITSDWESKQRYWALLDDLDHAIGRGRRDDLARVQVKLQAFPPPGPKRA